MMTREAMERPESAGPRREHDAGAANGGPNVAGLRDAALVTDPG